MIKHKRFSTTKALACIVFFTACWAFFAGTAYARVEFSEESCDNGNTSWTVSEYDQYDQLVRWTVYSCDGDVTTYYNDAVNHDGNAHFADSVAFANLGGNWSVNGYLGGTLSYTVQGTSASVTITYGGLTTRKSHESGELTRPIDAGPSLIKKIIGYVPKADSLRFTSALNDSWQVEGYLLGKQVYTVKTDATGTVISLATETPLAKEADAVPAAAISISNLKAIANERGIRVTFQLATTSQNTEVKVFDEQGRQVSTYSAGYLDPGATTIQIPETTHLKSGGYFVRVLNGTEQKTEKLMVIK